MNIFRALNRHSGTWARRPSAGCLSTVLLAAMCVLFSASPSGQAQNYSIDWHTIDGGGGTCTGGV